ncbi:MAG: tryptophan--tRNA ligase [Buchnera aphidicola (Brevicoryne brassicae)]|uniref:Tryptophan--tRNA ligase n=1 Tax=Buchnera aphidicola (Brevicoryne brassicae) TaxID=911343 RepID=A0AAJ5TX98_9GAMM|nr:tryptophan--tRNA ligase [Buchnera aphidicola]QCI20077.1 tryptophan--tRNA ligase [Buchnera aphidicola (Brevicoryne brassicae)]WAI18902.1 MAG: tryptophan--tRNA ligase [Buchnera aphidicola (Brevicoryne brassicae)]
MISSKPVLFSAIQPSGNITIGNYIGTMRHWSKMQNNYDCFYCIADLHSLTTQKNNLFLKKSILDTISFYLACGVDPNKSIIFIQSHVYQHSQLNWILNCFSQFSELLRMTQFKIKRKLGNNYIEKTNVGLFNYPVLMASDILLYQTNFVPVGYDQKQHIELTRNIAKRFNSLYGDIFTLPEPLINEHGSKIKALLEPNKKMSKSDINKNNVIFLLDNISSVVLKIQQSVTDSEKPCKIYYDIEKKPGISNLLEILSAITNKNIEVLSKELQGIMYTEFKNIVSDSLSKFLYKLQKSYINYRNDELYLKKIVYEGAIKARLKSEKTLQDVQTKLGFLSFFK